MQDNQMKFLQIAMKHMPEAQQQLNKVGLELSLEMLQPFMTLFQKVMAEAYELGKEEALSKEK
jgi:competence protein ComZ